MNAQTSILESVNGSVSLKHKYAVPGVSVLAQNLLSYYGENDDIAAANAYIAQWVSSGTTKVGGGPAIFDTHVTEITYALDTWKSHAKAVQMTLIL